MSLCRTCEYALYDGMCMAHGRLTLLDAPACDDYKMHLDVEVSKLKAENAKLREELEAVGIAAYLYGRDDLKAENAKLREFATETWELLTCNEPVFVWKGLQELARNLGIEVDE